MSILHLQIVTLWGTGYSFSPFDLFRQLFIYTRWLLGIYFILWVIIQCFVLLFNYLRFSYWELLQVGSYVLLSCLYNFLRTSLLSGTRCSGLILCFFLIYLWHQPFLQRKLILFIKYWYLETKIWALIDTGMPLLRGLLSRQYYIYIYRCIYHPYIQVYFYIHLSVHIF